MTVKALHPGESDAVIYPESDGQPLSDNTIQFRWIMTLKGGLDAVFRNDPNVFVAGDLLWYPVQGDNRTRMAPDVFVAFGRPKGDRGSYLQWLEDDIAPHVVFEILSPGNRSGEMRRKFDFYQRFGVEEYYLYNPMTVELAGWLRDGEWLRPITDTQGWVSPRLGIRFEIGEDDDLAVYGPDGRLFTDHAETVAALESVTAERNEALRRAERLAARLRELGIDPDNGG